MRRIGVFFLAFLGTFIPVAIYVSIVGVLVYELTLEQSKLALINTAQDIIPAIPMAEQFATSCQSGVDYIADAVRGPWFLLAFTISNVFMAAAPMLMTRAGLIGVRLGVGLLLTCSALVVGAHAIIYQLGGVLENGVLNCTPTFAQSLYLSLTMMSSLGFGDVIGADAVRLYVAAQAIFGFFMFGGALGLIVSSVGNGSHHEEATEQRPELEHEDEHHEPAPSEPRKAARAKVRRIRYVPLLS